jgi:hypothetical protein
LGEFLSGEINTAMTRTRCRSLLPLLFAVALPAQVLCSFPEIAAMIQFGICTELVVPTILIEFGA